MLELPGLYDTLQAFTVLKCCSDEISLFCNHHHGVATEAFFLCYVSSFVCSLLYRENTTRITITLERIEILTLAMKILSYSFDFVGITHLARTGAIMM